MYWPIGPARALEQRLPTHTELWSHDDPESPSGTRTGLKGEVQDNGIQQELRSSHASNQAASPTTKRFAAANGHSNGKANTDSLDHDDGHILELEAARGGQIFATITRTSLSVWQTKVQLFSGTDWSCSA